MGLLSYRAATLDDVPLLVAWHADPEVSDVEQVAAVLRERGLRLLYDEPRSGTAGSRVNFVHPKDAGGVLVELVEPAADTTH